MLQALRHYLPNRYIALDLALAACLISVWLFPQSEGGFLSAIERLGSRFARRKRLAILSVALAAVLVRLGLLWVSPVPIPRFHDEFSYLLAGDTFAHGRLTNPPHPMWVFLDTIHVNQRPTYMSKYPPGQGFFLALGEILGNPWIGVVLSVAGMCAAVLWMLQGWLPATWALLGAVLVLLRLGIFNYWMNSYWGGAVAAIGGALVVGAFPRILRFHRARDAVILGLGAAILVNTRPFEGFFLCLPVAAAILIWLCSQRRPSWSVIWRRLILPLGLLTVLSAGFVAYYNWQGTGSAFLMPYAVNDQTYSSTPLFIWQKERPAVPYTNPQLQAFYGVWVHEAWLASRPDNLSKLLGHSYGVAKEFVKFFMWPELCLPLLALPWILRDRRVRLLIVLIAFCLCASLTATWFEPHYIAPLTACIFALLIQGARHIRLWKYRGRRVGIGLVRVMVLFALLAILVQPPGAVVGPEPPSGLEYRARFEAQLNGLPGSHLAIVRYGANHSVHSEWVYNRADVDGAKIVWARDISGRELKPLLNYFRGRQVWLVEPDLTPPRLGPYPNPRREQ
jgi:hypothetical protein